MRHLLPISISKSAFAALVWTGVSGFSLVVETMNYTKRPFASITGYSG